MPIRFEDLLWGLQFVSVDPEGANEACVNRTTGENRCRSALDTLEPEMTLPEDADERDWIGIPGPKELGLGKPAVLEFASAHMESDFDQIRDIFGRSGAYRRFRALLERRGATARWYEYYDAAEKAALRVWAEDEGLDISG
jgi:hypothetical protein